IFHCWFRQKILLPGGRRPAISVHTRPPGNQRRLERIQLQRIWLHGSRRFHRQGKGPGGTTFSQPPNEGRNTALVLPLVERELRREKAYALQETYSQHRGAPPSKVRPRGLQLPQNKR